MYSSSKKKKKKKELRQTPVKRDLETSIFSTYYTIREKGGGGGGGGDRQTNRQTETDRKIERQTDRESLETVSGTMTGNFGLQTLYLAVRKKKKKKSYRRQTPQRGTSKPRRFSTYGTKSFHSGNWEVTTRLVIHRLSWDLQDSPWEEVLTGDGPCSFILTERERENLWGWL